MTDTTHERGDSEVSLGGVSSARRMEAVDEIVVDDEDEYDDDVYVDDGVNVDYDDDKTGDEWESDDVVVISGELWYLLCFVYAVFGCMEFFGHLQAHHDLDSTYQLA
jgi:hypothetical protein